MSDTFTGTGRCLCGQTRFSAKTIGKDFGACHCSMCRKWGSGPFMATGCGTQVTFDNEQNISVYNSSDWAERGFCKLCGTHLFYRLKQTGQHFMPIGLFDDDSNFTFERQVFIDSKPDYYCFSNETNNMTGEEVFAKYAPPE